MPTKPDLKALWNKHRLTFIQMYMDECIQKVSANNLEYRYTDLNGKAYFGFPKDMAKSVERTGKIQYFLELLLKGLSPEEDKAIDEAMNAAIEAGLNNTKNKSAAKIGALIMEREKRRQLVFHTEILYNLLAVQWIREDENPSVYSNAIQMQKVDQFKREVEERGAYPFFRVPELTALNSFYNLTKDEWMQFWQESLIKQQALKKALQTFYSSVKDLDKSKTTLMEQ